ncbi:MAG: hypothetical protein OEZ16_00240 [Chromatiales bacterium]|nr:hypothetical protein [Chromatiales bacterium]
MERESSELLKHREIHFCRLHPDQQQAQSASLLLADVEGIHQLRPDNAYLLQISYDITQLNLNLIEDVLIDLGFHLDNSLIVKLKRALYYYTEEVERANLGIDECGYADRQVFINRYCKLPHGCRDQRPEHWRNYL